MRKILKTPLIIICCFVSIVIIVVIAFFNYVNKVHFIYDNADCGVVVDGQDLMQIKSEGYTINYPRFHNVSSFTSEKYDLIYLTVTDPISTYTMDIAKTYRNYAKLDYLVEIKEDDTLTIIFTGYGYPDEGKGEPVALDKTFIYDISNVSPSNLPKLISEM